MCHTTTEWRDIAETASRQSVLQFIFLVFPNCLCLLTIILNEENFHSDMGTLLPILDIYSMLIYPFLTFVMYGFSFPYNRVYMQLSLMTLITSSAIIFVQSHS